MSFEFRRIEPWPEVSPEQWQDWRWQFRSSLRTLEDFARLFNLSESERKGLTEAKDQFKVQATPYYAALSDRENPLDPIRLMTVPTARELQAGVQQMSDPLGERKHSPLARIIHRYPDRVLFLVTDTCSVYCRYCLRKHFTGQDEALVGREDYARALNYLREARGVREVILSGGDPLTLSDSVLERIFSDLQQIKHLDLVRIGTRMPVVAPMRITKELVTRLKRFHPIYIMVHFNHPREVTADAADALTQLVDHGFPVFNQMVLLRGVNNHPAIVQALSRRLLRLRVKPYYMFQCDPSQGTDHFRTSVPESLALQRELWGRMSGLAMPNLSLDIPGGGGKVGLTPDFLLKHEGREWRFRGWDGIEATYVDPEKSLAVAPADVAEYTQEWDELRGQKYGR